jgi:hypothetical protein
MGPREPRCRAKEHGKKDFAVHQCGYRAYRGEASYCREFKELLHLHIVKLFPVISSANARSVLV